MEVESHKMSQSPSISKTNIESHVPKRRSNVINLDATKFLLQNETSSRRLIGASVFIPSTCWSKNSSCDRDIEININAGGNNLSMSKSTNQSGEKLDEITPVIKNCTNDEHKTTVIDVETSNLHQKKFISSTIFVPSSSEPKNSRDIEINILGDTRAAMEKRKKEMTVITEEKEEKEILSISRSDEEQTSKKDASQKDESKKDESQKKIDDLLQRLTRSKEDVEKQRTLCREERVNLDITRSSLIDMQVKYIREYGKHKQTQKVSDEKYQELSNKLNEQQNLIEKLVTEKNALSVERDSRISAEQKIKDLESCLTKERDNHRAILLEKCQSIEEMKRELEELNTLNERLKGISKSEKEFHQKELQAKQQIIEELSKEKLKAESTLEKEQDETAQLKDVLDKREKEIRELEKGKVCVENALQSQTKSVDEVINKLQYQLDSSNIQRESTLHKVTELEEKYSSKELMTDVLKNKLEKTSKECQDTREALKEKVKAFEKLAKLENKMATKVEQREIQLRARNAEVAKLNKALKMNEESVRNKNDELIKAKDKLKRQEAINKSLLNKQKVNKTEAQAKDEELSKVKNKLAATQKYVISLKEEITQQKSETDIVGSTKSKKKRKKKNKSQQQLTEQDSLEPPSSQRVLNKNEKTSDHSFVGQKASEDDMTTKETENEIIVTVTQKNDTTKPEAAAQNSNITTKLDIEFDEEENEDKGWGFKKILLFVFFIISIVLCFDLYLSTFQSSIWDLADVSIDLFSVIQGMWNYCMGDMQFSLLMEIESHKMAQSPSISNQNYIESHVPKRRSNVINLDATKFLLQNETSSRRLIGASVFIPSTCWNKNSSCGRDIEININAGENNLSMSKSTNQSGEKLDEISPVIKNCTNDEHKTTVIDVETSNLHHKKFISSTIFVPSSSKAKNSRDIEVNILGDTQAAMEKRKKKLTVITDEKEEKEILSISRSDEEQTIKKSVSQKDASQKDASQKGVSQKEESRESVSQKDVFQKSGTRKSESQEKIDELLQQLTRSKEDVEKQRTLCRKERVNLDITRSSLIDMQVKYIREYGKHKHTRKVSDEKHQELFNKLNEKQNLIEKLVTEKNALSVERDSRISAEQKIKDLESCLTKERDNNRTILLEKCQSIEEMRRALEELKTLNERLKGISKSEKEFHQKELQAKQQIIEKLSKEKLKAESILEKEQDEMAQLNEVLDKREKEIKELEKGKICVENALKCQTKSVDEVINKLQDQLNYSNVDRESALDKVTELVEKYSSKELMIAVLKNELEKTSKECQDTREALKEKVKAFEKLAKLESKMVAKVEQREIQLRARNAEVVKLNKAMKMNEESVRNKNDKLMKAKDKLKRQEAINKSLLNKQKVNKTEARTLTFKLKGLDSRLLNGK
ncbi:putative leucine-rich repeat-containing protein DDB_G0290503 [Clytia hemisphaerica]|uniref:putative leucine-rich repeat-containing protein DDB_G0290503 n=1 Tax=Clytia hemisphaerica TaxID=252671 RepID=UPI0034D5D298